MYWCVLVIVDVGVVELLIVVVGRWFIGRSIFVVVDGTFCRELLMLHFLFNAPELPLLLPVLLFTVEPSGVGDDKGGDIIPPMPESFIIDFSAKPGDERGIRCDCNGTDSGETKAFGVEVDTKFENSGMNP